MAQMFNPNRRFDERFRDAARILGVDAEDLVAVKVRPIQSAGGFEDANAYVYPDEYAVVYEGMAHLQVDEPRRGLDGVYRTLELPDGVRILFVEHETGPEIIFVLALLTKAATAIGVSATAGLQILKLINAVKDAVERNNKRKERGEKVLRHYTSEGISIEKRLCSGARILKRVSTAASEGKKIVKDIQELIA
jgi:hypothetical protein